MEGSPLRKPTQIPCYQSTPMRPHPQSSQKRTKIFIGKNGVEHRQDYLVFKTAPMVRVDVSPEKEQVESEKEDPKLKELRDNAELIKQRQMEKDEVMQKYEQMRRKMEELMRRKLEEREKNEKLRKCLIASNLCQEKLARSKVKKNQMTPELYYQAKRAQNIQERQLIEIEKRKYYKEEEIKVVEKELEEKKRKREEITSKVEVLNEKNEKIEKISEERQRQCDEINENIRIVGDEVDQSTIEVSVLRMQIYQKVRFGFSTVSLDPEGDRKRILDKSSILWPRNKFKHFSCRELRDFILIQLYPQWKKILNKISSDFVGYRKLLCYPLKSEEEKALDISLYLPRSSQGNKPITSKSKSVLALYSPLPSQREEVLKTLKQLEVIDNGILRITSVSVRQLQNNEEICIEYIVQGVEKVRRIDLVMLKVLSRETILRLFSLNKQNLIMMIMVEVPLVCSSSAERSQYQEAYQTLKRYK